MAELAGNVLFYGDNLDVLQRHVEDESVDLLTAIRRRSKPSLASRPEAFR
jgi:hypothetical protein